MMEISFTINYSDENVSLENVIVAQAIVTKIFNVKNICET